MLVLCLNKSWLPINLIQHRDCMRLLCKCHAKAMDQYYNLHTWDSWLDTNGIYELEDTVTQYSTINTVRLEIPIPEIIVLEYYNKIPARTVTYSKENLFIRDEGMCQYCGIELSFKDATIDHIHPKSKGGETSFQNCILSCSKCNHTKDAYLLDTLDTHNLLKEPKHPNPTNPLYKYGKNGHNIEVKESWKKFLLHL